MENPTHRLRETKLVLQPIEESQIKSKTVMSWISQKKKEGIFCTFILSERNFFNTCILSPCITYWINFRNIHTFTCTFLLVFKIVKCPQCILKYLFLKRLVYLMIHLLYICPKNFVWDCKERGFPNLNACTNAWIFSSFKQHFIKV